MKTVMLGLIMLGFLLSATAANAVPHGNRGIGVGHKTEDINGSNEVPPGLKNKSRPYGLEKQNKRPYGWSKGKKKGWYKRHHKRRNMD